MADFHYLHEHPWLTLGAIAGGGFLLYLIIHRRNSTAATTDQTVYTGTPAQGVDPNIAAQLAGQQLQAQAQITGLSIQGQTQTNLAQIGANVEALNIAATQDVANKQTAAGQDVTNRQTDAQLQLGLGTLGAQVASKQIDAQVAMANLDAIVAAFTGAKANNTVSVPVYNSPGNPINGVNPIQSLPWKVPDYTGAGSASGTSPASNPAANPALLAAGVGTGSVIPGGTQLLPYPTYVHSDPSQYPGMAPGATCSPLDANCVAQNAAISNDYHQDVAQAQTVNNLTALVSNYQLSAQMGTLTPSQKQEMDYYSQQLTQAGGTVPTYVAPTPARVFPAQVNTF